METDFKKEDLMTVFEAMASRLNDLDGMYGWNDDIDLIRKALEIAGYWLILCQSLNWHKGGSKDPPNAL